MTVRDVINKLRDIEHAIELVDLKLPEDDVVIDLLEEYAEMIRNIKIDI